MTTNQELIERLRVDEPACEEHFTANLAADRIEELVKEMDISRMASVVMDNTVEELEGKLALMIFERDEAWKRAAHSEKMWGEAEVKLAKAVEALKSLHHVVCGKNGFAAAVRNHSGKTYPWEPLDIADEQTRTVLAELGVTA